MPRKAPRPCQHPGCPGLSTARFPYCPKHLPAYEKKRIEALRKRKKRRQHDRKYDKSRPSAAKRGYDRRWRKDRELYLARNPLCSWKGCRKLAEEVDHIVALSKGGTHDWSNLQGFCKRHHSMKTARVDNPATRKKTYVDEMGRRHKR